MNPLYDDIENKLQQNVHDINEQNNNIQIEFNLSKYKLIMYYITQVIKFM
jgi:hypothetical protein